MGTYECPLCHQTVSANTYNKITGIWAERQKQLKQIKVKEVKLKEERRELLTRMKEQQAKFKQQSANIKRVTLRKASEQFERKLKVLKNEKNKIEEQARKKIEKATQLAHSKAQKEFKHDLDIFKKQNASEMRNRVDEERCRAREEAKLKYRERQILLESYTKQIKGMSAQSKEQQARIKELEEEMKKQTTPQIEGLLYEDELIRELKKHFPKDTFDHAGKKGDVIHHILGKDGKEIGKIVYECKRVKKYDKKFVMQALEAKQIRKADFAILVTTVMKPKTQGFFAERGILIVHPAGVVSLVSILRDQIAKIAQMKLGQQMRNAAIKQTLKYLQSPEFSNSIEAITEEAINSYKELNSEVKKHLESWRKRYYSYIKIYNEAINVKDATGNALSGGVEKTVLEDGTFPELQRATIDLPLEQPKEEKKKRKEDE
ncbi:Uncharacterised protein [uncultured archaeon]|nr:Uncharacterised protein [uncultured archaeon]